MVKLRALTAALLVGLLWASVTPLVADGASPARLAKQVRQALSLSKDTRHDVTVLAGDLRKQNREQGDRQGDLERSIQTVNGRVSALPPTFRGNETHEHASTGDVAPDTKGSVTASCAADESVVSGGYEYDTNQGITIPQPVVTGERASGGSWAVTLNNLGGSTTVSLRVFANCVPK